MILIYANIAKYKNYEKQEVTFDTSYSVQFQNGVLEIKYNGFPDYQTLSHPGKLDNLHILVGKTGSGKTNLLQLIGAKNDTRSHRMWDGEPDSYFLLYKINETEFFLEICNVEIRQFPHTTKHNDPTVPESIKPNATRMDTLRTVRFSIPHVLAVGESSSDYTIIQEFGSKPSVTERVRDFSAIINSYDINSFIEPPYEDERETYDDFRSDWIGRMVVPYHRTSLWKLCDYIREYIADVETGHLKREVSFVLSSHNFADSYPIKLPNAVEEDYWTFSSLARDLRLESVDDDAKARLKRRKRQVQKIKQLSPRNCLFTTCGRITRCIFVNGSQRYKITTRKKRYPKTGWIRPGQLMFIRSFLTTTRKKNIKKILTQRCCRTVSICLL